MKFIGLLKQLDVCSNNEDYETMSKDFLSMIKDSNRANLSKEEFTIIELPYDGESGLRVFITPQQWILGTSVFVEYELLNKKIFTSFRYESATKDNILEDFASEAHKLGIK